MISISIHSPRMGRDRPNKETGKREKNFNPLSPHGERPATERKNLSSLIFQSTLPAWGETRLWNSPKKLGEFQSTLPAWGETPRGFRRKRPYPPFQSTLPAWGETRQRRPTAVVRRFQSTLPAWGETGHVAVAHLRRIISIHSPRMGRDLLGSERPQLQRYFNPLSPHGERPHFPPINLMRLIFQSALPAWGETQIGVALMPILTISIRSPRMGRDGGSGNALLIKFQSTLPAWGETRLSPAAAQDRADFNPLSPHGERQAHQHLGNTLPISIHSPRMGRDRRDERSRHRGGAFQSTLPAWGETLAFSCSLLDPQFQSTLPAWGETRQRELCMEGWEIFQSTLPAWGETMSIRWA